jgi:hypothetical protein
MPGRALEISGTKVLYLHGYIQLPQMKPFPLLIKGRKTMQFHSTIWTAALQPLWKEAHGSMEMLPRSGFRMLF